MYSWQYSASSLWLHMLCCEVMLILHWQGTPCKVKFLLLRIFLCSVIKSLGSLSGAAAYVLNTQIMGGIMSGTMSSQNTFQTLSSTSALSVTRLAILRKDWTGTSQTNIEAWFRLFELYNIIQFYFWLIYPDPELYFNSRWKQEYFKPVHPEKSEWPGPECGWVHSLWTEKC